MLLDLAWNLTFLAALRVHGASVLDAERLANRVRDERQARLERQAIKTL